MDEFDHVTRSEAEPDSIHDRWIRDRNRGRDDQEYEEYQESWVEEQCGGCRFWIPPAGRVGNDYGACSNARTLGRRSTGVCGSNTTAVTSLPMRVDG